MQKLLSCMKSSVLSETVVLAALMVALRLERGRCMIDGHLVTILVDFIHSRKSNLRSRRVRLPRNWRPCLGTLLGNLLTRGTPWSVLRAGRKSRETLHTCQTLRSACLETLLRKWAHMLDSMVRVSKQQRRKNNSVKLGFLSGKPGTGGQDVETRRRKRWSDTRDNQHVRQQRERH